MKICVTGASGFVGKRFIECSTHIITTLSLRNNNWADTNFGAFDCILHLAGKAHDMSGADGQAYYDINVKLTERLVQKAIADNCQHLVYMSSIKVYGDTVQEVISEKSAYNPNDDYGKSKQQAEELLLARSDKIKISIVRPPLIYGAGVKGNMKKMMKLAAKKIPLPFGHINNQRSVVFLDNLVDLLDEIISQQADGIFLATDGQTVSTSHIISEIRRAQGSSPNLISIPYFVRAMIKRLKPNLYTRLFGSYVLDDSQTKKQLNYTAKHTFADGIKQMVSDYESKL